MQIDVSRLAGSVDAFEMDRNIFQKYSYFQFLQNVSRKRTAEDSEFDECFQKRSYALEDDIVVPAVSAAGLLGRQPERSPKGPDVLRDQS